MLTVEKRGMPDYKKIVYIKLCDISVPPSKIRKKCVKDDEELKRSILRYGVLQPIAVRMQNPGYELIAGSRRYFAAEKAGLSVIPCIILNVDTPEGELIALTENLQRRNLDYVEEAQELHRLIHLHNFSQEEASRRTGRSQPAIANKLRLLKLPYDLLCSARDAGVTERHLRELLRLGNAEKAGAVLLKIIAEDLTVSDTEKYVDTLINPRPEPKIAIGSAALFKNTVEHAAVLMRKGGFNVDITLWEEDDVTELNILISRKPPL